MTDPALFSIHPGGSEPIYRQLMAQVRRCVAGGQLRAGDELPSVRELAQALAVNPMTISKAFSLLEAEGLLERRRGLAMTVAARAAPPPDPRARLALLEPRLQQLADEARQLRIAPAAVQQRLGELLATPGAPDAPDDSPALPPPAGPAPTPEH